MKEKLNIFFLCFFIAVFVAAAAIWLVFSYRYRQQLSNEEHTYKEIQNKLIRENTVLRMQQHLRSQHQLV